MFTGILHGLCQGIRNHTEWCYRMRHPFPKHKTPYFNIAQTPFTYMLGIRVAPSCLWSHNARYIMRKSYYDINYLLLIYYEVKICKRSSEAWGGESCIVENYNMTVWILAGNYISFTIAAGLIKLHVCPVSRNLVCNLGERVSPYSQWYSLAPFIGNSSNHWGHKQHYNLLLCLQILCKYVLLR